MSCMVHLFQPLSFNCCGHWCEVTACTHIRRNDGLAGLTWTQTALEGISDVHLWLFRSDTGLYNLWMLWNYTNMAPFTTGLYWQLTARLHIKKSSRHSILNIKSSSETQISSKLIIRLLMGNDWQKMLLLTKNIQKKVFNVERLIESQQGTTNLFCSMNEKIKYSCFFLPKLSQMKTYCQKPMLLLACRHRLY